MIMCATIERGLTLADFENMTIGMILDYIITYNDRNYSGDDTIRKATQADIDLL